MGRFGATEWLVLLLFVLFIVIIIPLISYKAGKKRGIEIGKNIGFREGLNHKKEN